MFEKVARLVGLTGEVLGSNAQPLLDWAQPTVVEAVCFGDPR
jgi:hypothetical protein